MRKFVRNNILDLQSTIKEGLEYAISVDEASANAVLCDGVEAIKAITQTLEQELSPDGFKGYIPYISDLLKAFEILLTDVDDVKIINNTLNEIFKLFESLNRRLKKEPEVKREIVFFPYKASMWDSLESIWKAAKQDDRCFVSVAPIPYYDKDGYGNHLTQYYERELFPDYVETIRYDEFDLEIVQPDVAYIHNPYDGNNHVSSVHPSYYSRTLKKHVKTLVYVPYFAKDTPPSLPVASITSLLAADIIVAASNDDVAAYRNAGARCDVVPLGSPKIDRIINLDNDKPAIPEEWSKLAGKKIFFLNTSINSLLKYESAYINKIQALITLFDERNDAALLWRPHPLTVSTITSMRPDLLDMYKSVEEQAKNSRSTVIDLTPDMGVSMAISDAYIGDGISSLVYLYALTGKPLYQINFKIPIAPTPEELAELATSDTIGITCIDGEEVWIFCGSVNALCKLDINTGQAEYVSSVPGEENAINRYIHLVKIGDRILLSPYCAKEWAEYDIPSGTWTKYPIPDEALPITRNGGCFYVALDTDEFVIFMPINSRAFVKYDKKTREFEYNTIWFRSFEPYVFNIDYGFFNAGGTFVDNSLYIASLQSNVVVELNVRSMRTKIHKVGESGNRYNGITFDGDCFWLTKFLTYGLTEPQNSVVRWDKNTGRCKELILEPVTREPVNMISDFYSITFYNGKVLVFPFGVNEIFQIDPKTEDISVLETCLPYKLGSNKSPYYSYGDGVASVWIPNKCDGRIVLYSFYDYSLLFFDSETFEVKKVKPVINGIEHLFHNLDTQPPYVRNESVFLTAAGYVVHVVSGSIPDFNQKQADYHRGINFNSDGTCGQKTHEFVMRKSLKK